MARKVLIINEGYSSNLGDQAIKDGMEKLMQTLGFETDFCYFTAPGLTALPHYDYKALAPVPVSHRPLAKIKKKLFPFLSVFIYWRYFITTKKQIKARLQDRQYDMVVIGGGQLINSTRKQRLSFFAISLYLWSKAVAKMPHTPLYLIGVGVAGSFYAFEKYVYKKVSGRVKNIWVRDRFSQISLMENFGKRSDLIPDVAFFEPGGLMVYEKKPTALVGIYSYEEYSKKFKVDHEHKAAYYEHWKTVVKNFTDRGLAVTLFYTTTSDAAETFLFQQYLAKEQLNIEVAAINNLEDLHTLYEHASVVYSARMHALILALKKGCRVEAYLISQKLRSFVEDYVETGIHPEELSNRLFQTFNSYFKGSFSAGIKDL